MRDKKVNVNTALKIFLQKMSTNWFLKTHIYVNIKKRGRIFMKKIISVLMVAVMLLGVFSLSAFAENEEPEKTWSTSFDETTGTLTVSGTGTVEALYPDGLPRPDYHTYYEREEDDYSVKKLIIEEGITSIRVSFSRLNNLTEVVLPNSLTEILGCFNKCPSLTSITIPAGVKIWERSFYYDCDSLSEINFLGPVFIGCIEDYNFCHLPSLTTLTVPSGSFLGGAFDSCENLKKVRLIGRVEIAEASCEDFEYRSTFALCHEDLVVYVDNKETYQDVYTGYDGTAEFYPFKVVNTSEVTEAPTTNAPKPEKTTKKPSNEAPKTTLSNIKVDSQGTNENPTTTPNETTTENLTQNTSVEAPKTTEKTTIVNSQNTNEKNTDNKTIIIISVVAVIIIAGAIAVIIIKKKKQGNQGTVL